MTDEKKKTGPIKAIFGIVIAVGLIWFFFGGGLDRQVAKDMQKNNNQVADDFVKQYGIARRNGTAIDVCLAASLVSAAYLQAKDEPNYRHWKDIEKSDCAEAGMPK
jgi:hypothetical protein